MVQRFAILIGCGLSILVAATAGAKDATNQEPLTEKVIELLRNRNPEGLQVALVRLDKLTQRRAELQAVIAKMNGQAGNFSKSGVPSAGLNHMQYQIDRVNQQLNGLRLAIDQIGGQRGCTVSRLYWYTDLTAAQAEAERTGRPILSLRMLGKLTDEFSCANSRFFRTALYSNSDISSYLRDHFVLHWQSVRPVPRVTIDFGDGRKLERTLTGNSAHYVLTAEGRPLDVLPGLYSPQEFQAWLARLEQFHRDYSVTAEEERAKKLADFHREHRQQVYREWAGDIQRLGKQPAALVAARIEQSIETAHLTGSNSPLAKAAALLAETKMAAETPLLRYAIFKGPWIESGMDDGLWQAIADLHREEVKLDDASVEVMRKEFPPAEVAGKISVTKGRQEDPILRVARAFEDSMSLDTVRNEYLLHRRVHERLAEGAAGTDNLDALNEWVYAELFLTPSSDPWLGLAPRDVYTALEGDGRVEARNEITSRSGGS